MNEAMVHAATTHRVMRGMLNRWMWILWLALFISLSYKLKTLGEPGIRPLYIAGVMFGYAALFWLRLQHLQVLQWRSKLDVLVVINILLILGYVLAQSFAYPDSFTAVVYTVSTAFLVYSVAFLAIVVRGWKPTLRDIYTALLVYSVVNIILVLVSVVFPETAELIIVSPLISGYGIRPSGMPGDPTQLGALMSVTLLLMLVLRREIYGRWSLLFAFMLVVGVFATGSRNSVLSLMLGCFTVLIVDRRSASVILRLGIVLVVTGLATLAVASTTPEVFEYLNAVFRLDDENALSRLYIWSDMWNLWSRLGPGEWLFGGGFLFIQEVYGSPYNAFIRILFNHGFVVVQFLALTLVLFASAIVDKCTLRRQAALGLLVYWLSFSMFLDTWLAEFFHFAEFCFWLASALLTARTIRAKKLQHRPVAS
jgi:hypothetical protein